jgi:hypothetical protein
MESHHIKMDAISDLTDFSYEDLDFKKYKFFSITTK